MADIERLDPETRDAIAAGEVVTRPAAVVVELVENSLDAGATEVTVRVDGDGTERIRVADDGRGMGREDAPLAVERHATSKLASADDLRTVSTLGFRGEALPSIAAVSRFELTTNAGEREGTRVVVDDGGETRVSTAGRARGTTVEVRDLFFNRPARRSSLSSPATEFGRISDRVAGYALVNPDVRFRLLHDGSETLSTPGTGVTDAALGVYGREVASESTELDAAATVEAAGREREVGVSGLLAYPSTTRATPDAVTTAVNGRPVSDRALREAVRAGYGTLLPEGRHPVAAVAVSLSPAAVDANVHPAKESVDLLEADPVADAVERAVSDALSTADMRRRAETATDLDELGPATAESRFDGLSVIGQFRGLYVLCEAGDELVVVDQHAAHERVNYERLRAAVGDVEAVPLDPPRTLSLSPGEVTAVEAHGDALAALGFDADPFGGGTVRLRSAPAPLGRVADADAFRDALDHLTRGDDPGDAREDLLKELACHPSLKAGDGLGREAAATLVERLGACEEPYACPHGRPTVLAIEEATLARGFERGNTRL
jgi:DNA mismatch repair protein MutL